ncbi:MAG: hypothetical protein FWC66_07280 [Oscillospiraceae bacterium]|nr:hypothetical protein [Oscillospiraceae bacterium]
MNKKTRSLTLAALFTALTVVLLYIASLWPTGQLGLVAVASLLVAAAVIESGLSFGIFVFVASSALSLLLIPNRVAALLFIVFLGYYPVLKSLIEQRRGNLLQWALKLAVFNAALTIVWFLMRHLLIGFFGDLPGIWLVYLGGNIVFLFFDYGFTKLIWFYINRISKYINRKV